MQFKYLFKLLNLVSFNLSFYFIHSFISPQMTVLDNTLDSTYLIWSVLCKAVES